MRTVLSRCIADSAIEDERFLLLSGDHGYALFDELITARKDQFVNVGIMEQALIGMAAGLARVGYRPMCYGLGSFVPIRVLEQIKFDVSLSDLPVKIIGDGAGLVYSVLGNSHLCAEDVACLMPLPHVEIYAPGDPEEMRACYREFSASERPAYLRVGKSDNPVVNTKPLATTEPYFTNRAESRVCLISTGAMLGVVAELAKHFQVDHLSIMKLKPLAPSVVPNLQGYDAILVFEEHSRKGGLLAQILDQFVQDEVAIPRVKAFCLNHSFIEKCGSYQHAISEHGMQKEQLLERVGVYLQQIQA